MSSFQDEFQPIPSRRGLAVLLTTLSLSRLGLSQGQATASSIPVSPTGRNIGDIPGLTSIRGVAALWVLVFHIWCVSMPSRHSGVFALIAHGYLAVDLFFVLSGYIIALNYASRLATPDARSWRAFIWLRIARIYPLHLFMLLSFISIPIATSLFAHRGVPAGQFDLPAFLRSLVLVQSWGFDVFLKWNPPAWSISTELFAYILFPPMLWLTRGVRRRPWAWWTLALVSLFLLALIARSFGDSLTVDIRYLGLFRCVFNFGLACASSWPRASRF